ncbi:MAG TPA: MATE family efflux transporter [Gemmatimonadaceae bacterium]|nr:MATE family efflux transporter [Gemmatimonadaceae bacterium]
MTTRPEEHDPRFAQGGTGLPIEPHEGLAPVVVTSERQASEIVTGDLRTTTLKIAIPAVAASLLMTLFASVDAYWVGRKLGPSALAAVSTSLFYIWMAVALGEMVGVGLTSVAARRHGEGRHEEATRVAGDAIVFSLILGALLSAIGTLMLPKLFTMLGTNAEVSALGRRYLGTYLIGLPLIYGFFAVDATFRAAGDTRTPLLLLVGSVGVTLVLDPLLILGLAGFPELGIVGAAIATLATRGVVFAGGCAIAMRRGLLKLGRVSRASIIAVCRVGLPTAVTGIVFSIIYIGIARIATPFGTPALAALGIGHRVESWLFMVGVGFGAATAAIVGQNLGAGRPDRAEKAGWIAAAYCSVLGIASFASQILAPEWLAGIFSTDPAVIREAASYLRIAAVSQLAISLEMVLDGALGGAGDTVPPMVASTTLSVLRIPLAAFAATHWGTAGIWWVISLTACGRALALVLLWRSRRWLRKSV